MMSHKTIETKGLPGCKPIREALELTQAQLAQMVGVHLSFIFCVENGRKDCSQSVQRRIAGVLGCEVVDLIQQPTEERIQEIKSESEVRKAQEVLARHQPDGDKKAGAA